MSSSMHVRFLVVLFKCMNGGKMLMLTLHLYLKRSFAMIYWNKSYSFEFLVKRVIFSRLMVWRLMSYGRLPCVHVHILYGLKLHKYKTRASLSLSRGRISNLTTLFKLIPREPMSGEKNAFHSNLLSVMSQRTVMNCFLKSRIWLQRYIIASTIM